MARGNQKTKRCPYCAAQLTLNKAKKVAHKKTAREASNYIRELKNKNNY